MKSSDYKFRAKQALDGRWGIAVLGSLIASALGAVGGSVSFGSVYTGGGGSSTGENDILMDEGTLSVILVIALVVIGFALAFALAQFIVGSAVWVGYSKFNLNLTARNESVNIGVLFSYFKNLKNAVGTRFLRGLYVFLWSLLFYIPGVIASYSYAMVGYILAENPELSPSEALDESKRLMNGRRWNLFCLDFSFIGWHILCVLSLGVGYIWLVPYIQASYAEFYRRAKLEDSGILNADFEENSLFDRLIGYSDDSKLTDAADDLENATPSNEENGNSLD